MTRPFLLRKIRADQRGVTAVEFAFVAPVFCLSLMGFFDLGYRTYVSSMVQGALHEAARLATVGDKTPAQIDAHVKYRLLEFSDGATVTVNKKSYSDFSDVAKPELITQDTAPFGQYNSTDCYEDANKNGQYDQDRGSTGLGNAEDVVYYEVSISYPRIVPTPKFLGWSANDTVKGATVLRNQPYAARQTANVVRCT